MHNDKFRTIIALFLQALYKCIETLAFLNICLKDPNRNGIITKSFLVSETDLIVTEIISAREHTDVYFEVCLQAEPPLPGKRGNAEGVKVIPGFWVDIDIAGSNHKSDKYPKDLDTALKFIYSLPWRASIIVCSGGGIHVYYLFSTPVVVADVEDKERMAELSRRVNRFIIAEGQKHGWKIDNTSDLARLLRVPATLNHKSVPAKDVYIIEYDPSALYNPCDFQIIFDEKDIVAEICNPATTPIALPSIISNTFSKETYDYPEANIDFIENHCSWLAHCNYGATTLPEPEWFAACSIWSRCKDGRSVAHERSKPYPGYDQAETDKKLDNALTAAPRTCASILSDLSAGQYCSGCFLQGKGKSPISLGNPNPIAQASIKMAKVIAGSQYNPKLAFEDDNLAALALLKLKSKGDFITVTNALKKAGIAKGEIRPVLDRFMATHEMSFDDVANYEVLSNCIHMNKATAQGMVLVLLCSFNAIITEEVIKDDGVTSERFYRIEGSLKSGEALPTVTLPVQEFESMTWLGRMWGAKAWYSAGASTRDNLRAAITYLSKNITTRYIFSHTGWSKAFDDWVFLSEAGAIGKEGDVDELTVDLSSSNLSAFSIPEPSNGISISEAIHKSLLLLKLLPKRIAYPLLSAVFRAPLGEPLPVAFALFIVGATGTRKTEVSAIAQSFFGSSFNGKKLPGNWSSTANFLEKTTHQAKDVIFVVDDYVPGDNPKKMNSIADRLFRALGNQAGRGRLNSDISSHQEYFPRALIVSTAEDVPSGQSLTGRMLVLEIAEGDVDLKVLTELQQLSSKGIFTSVMYEYLKWLAPQIDDLKRTLPPHKADLRSKAVEAEKTHTRTPDIIADLAIGFQSFCTFAISQGAMSEEDSAVLQNECWTSLLEAATQQQDQQKVGDPCELFRDFLLTAFLMGKAHLEAKTGGVPTHNPEIWGWKRIIGMKDDTGVPGSALVPQGSLIGWVDDKYVYLNSDGAYKVAQDVAGRDRQITTSLKTLMLRLAERKHLVPDPTTGRKTLRITVTGGHRSRVMQLDKSFFEDKDQITATNSTINQSGFVFQPKELQEGQIAPSGGPVLKDALLQKTFEENLFSAFSEQFRKK